MANAQTPAFLGAMPAFWGRYFYAPGQIDSSGEPDSHYSVGENAFLRAGNIRLMPIARQTGNVTGRAVVLISGDPAKPYGMLDWR